MGAFEFRALDATGRKHSGIIDADSERQVRQKLRDRKLSPLSVVAVQGERGDRSGRRAGSRIRLRSGELPILTRQLATLLQAGMPVEQALNAVAQQAERASAKRLTNAVRSRITEGYSMSQALAQHPGVFSDLYVKTVAAGEASGHLQEVLIRLADYLEQSEELRRKVTLALVYPAILTITAIAVILGLVTYVVPKISQVYESIDQQLPLLTRALIAASSFLQSYGLVLLVLLAGLIIGWMLLLRMPKFRYRYHETLLRLPLIRRTVRGLNTARFARSMSILAASRVPVLEALRTSADLIQSLPMRKAIQEASAKVREGSSISRSLQESRLFPPITLHLIANGESSGQLDLMLERAALHEERELETMTATLLALFEPVLILVMGGLVLIVVLAMLLPIFQLNQLVK
jgi:general secretion pathway protein F